MPDVRPDAYTRCHTSFIHHSMVDVDTDWKPGFPLSANMEPVTLRCERCSTERRIIIDGSGKIIYSRYLWPDNYRYGRGESPSPSDFRLMLLSLRLKEARQRRRGEGSARRAAAS